MSLIWHHWNVFKDGVPTFLFVDISQQLSLSCLTSVPVTSGSFIIKLPDFYSLSSLPEVVIGPIKIFSMKNVLFRRWWVLSVYHSLTGIMISWVDRELLRKSLIIEWYHHEGKKTFNNEEINGLRMSTLLGTVCSRQAWESSGRKLPEIPEWILNFW